MTLGDLPRDHRIRRSGSRYFCPRAGIPRSVPSQSRTGRISPLTLLQRGGGMVTTDGRAYWTAGTALPSRSKARPITRYARRTNWPQSEHNARVSHHQGPVPTRADFLSDKARRRRPRDLSEEGLRRHEGFSVWVSEDDAKRTARRFPALGAYIAAVEIPEEGSSSHGSTRQPIRRHMANPMRSCRRSSQWSRHARLDARTVR